MCLNARDDLSDGLVVITFQVLTLRLGPRGDEENCPVERQKGVENTITAALAAMYPRVTSFKPLKSLS
jgi:hypothetical protein